ncbi:MAG: hypothetical protein AAGE76_05280 [Pseudomonadota bacterium]
MDLIALGIAAVGVVVAYMAWQYPRHPAGAQPAKASGGASKPNAAEPVAAATAEAKPRSRRKPVPEGVVFGDKVVIVPGLQQGLFTHAGHIEWQYLSGQVYGWIQREDIIARYHVDRPKVANGPFRHFFGSDRETATIRSPISGLLLHSYFNDFVTWPASVDEIDDQDMPIAFSVLLPDDEPPPIKPEWTHRRAIQLLEDNKDLLFKDSMRWTRGPMPEDAVARLFQDQRDAQCLIVDALPRFRDYLEEARTKYPELRPHLKHLL